MIYTNAYHKTRSKIIQRICIYGIIGAGFIIFCFVKDIKYFAIFALPFVMLTIGKVWGLLEVQKSFKQFCALGNPQLLEKDFETELADEENFIFLKPLYITENWIFSNAKYDVFLLPISKLTWAFERQKNATSTLVLYFGQRDFEIHMDRENINAFLRIIEERNPETITGFSEELQDAYFKGKNEFETEIAVSPKKFIDNSSPIKLTSYYETIVYLKLNGEKKMGHLAFTHDMRIILACGKEILYDEEISCFQSIKRKGIGRFCITFHPTLEIEPYVIKSYNTSRWIRLLKKAYNCKRIPNYSANSYTSLDSVNYAIAQNNYYVKFAVIPVSLLFFALVLYSGIKENMIWEDGIFMGLITYFVLPLLFFPVAIKFLLYITGFRTRRMFPNKELGEF